MPPRILSFAEADARFDLRSVLPGCDEEQEVTLLDPGSYQAANLDLDQYSYVVDGDVELLGNLCATEEGHFLVVRGNLVVDSLLIGGPFLLITGSLTAHHAIHTDYNHGLLVVQGNVQAEIIAAEHSFQIGGKLSCNTTIDFGGFELGATDFSPTLNRQQAARESREYFIAEALNAQGYVNGAALAEVLASGRDPLRARPGH